MGKCFHFCINVTNNSSSKTLRLIVPVEVDNYERYCDLVFVEEGVSGIRGIPMDRSSSLSINHVTTITRAFEKLFTCEPGQDVGAYTYIAYTQQRRPIAHGPNLSCT